MTRRSYTVAGLTHGDQPIPNVTVVGNVLLTGGINGKDRESGTMPEDPAAEARNAFLNLKTIVEAAGATLEQVAKVTVFVKDKDIRQHVNAVWVELFPDADSRPVRHTLEQNLTGMRIQLDCTAVLDG